MIAPTCLLARGARFCLAGLIVLSVTDDLAAGPPSLGFLASGHFETTVEVRQDLDLEPGTAADLGFVQPEIEISLSYRPSRTVFFLNTWQVNRDFGFIDGGGSADLPTRLQLLVAEVGITDIADRFSLFAGRREFIDRRRWLYDTELDGFTLVAALARLKLELSLSREDAFEKDLLNADATSPVNNYFLHGELSVAPALALGAYALAREAVTGATNRPIFVGLRSWGRARQPFNHWVELSHVRGRQGDGRISGWAVDVGGTYVFDARHTPYFSLGYAFGTGDRDPADGVDHAYRQTGLETNQHRLGGVTRVQVYGELFTPELNNMSIYTVGGGFRPMPRTSIDVVYHHYRQVVRAAELGRSRLSADPTGSGKALGHEIDLVASYREIADFRLELALGYFIPGAAFPGSADAAVFAQFQLRYAF